MISLLVRANAKINLNFQIVNKLPSGLHQIKSDFQSIDLADFLLFEKASKNQFTGAIVCPEAQNIILKAQKRLARAVKKNLSCRIHLHKTIPIAAGLGGGSADAAATLFALNKIYHLDLSLRQLAEIGIKIGADVPFFFHGGTCRVEGVGEKIKPIQKKLPRFFVLFRPHKRLQTSQMYERYDQTKKSFFALAKELCPEIKILEKRLKKFSVKNLSLSGSGPTVFCAANDYDLAKKISESYPQFDGDIFICRPQAKGLEIVGSQE